MKAAKSTASAPVTPTFRMPPRTRSCLLLVYFLGGGWQEVFIDINSFEVDINSFEAVS